jgi:hypothetical protein
MRRLSEKARQVRQNDTFGDVTPRATTAFTASDAPRRFFLTSETKISLNYVFF